MGSLFRNENCKNKKQLEQVLSAEKDSILGDNLPDMWHL